MLQYCLLPVSPLCDPSHSHSCKTNAKRPTDGPLDFEGVTSDKEIQHTIHTEKTKTTDTQRKRQSPDFIILCYVRFFLEIQVYFSAVI